MFFTMDEVALIDGLIATYFVSDSVSEDVRVRYYETHQHLQDNRTDYVDLRNIELPHLVRTVQKRGPEQEILSFKRSGAAYAAPLLFYFGCAHGYRNRRTHQ